MISVCWLEDSSILAFSAASFNLCKAAGSVLRSKFWSFLNSSTKCSIKAKSKSSPPKKVSPLVERTSNCFSPSISASSIIEISNVPPPRSKTAIFWSPVFLSKPNANAAAVGSFIILLTSKPAIFPASLVACLCESLKYAGTVTTASFTSWPK